MRNQGSVLDESFLFDVRAFVIKIYELIKKVVHDL